MISQEQADTADVFHQTGAYGRPCDSKNGPIRWRRSGKTQRWKREPSRFRIPVKHGLYGHGDITHLTHSNIHTGADCPVAPEGHN